MVIIQTFQEISSTFIQTIKLDDVMYKLKIQYNARSESFMLSIYDADDTLIIAGLKLVANYVLDYQYNYLTTLPPGAFVLIDLEYDSTGVVSFENLGTRYQLIYLSKADVNEL
jgi:hypothetical protein